jgi:hypothetical protein
MNADFDIGLDRRAMHVSDLSDEELAVLDEVEILPEAVVRKNSIRIFSVGPRREYGMISGCSGFCTSLSEWSAT